MARVAAMGPDGPTVRPVWFLFEGGMLWWLTGSYSRLSEWLSDDARVSVVIGTCDLVTGGCDKAQGALVLTVPTAEFNPRT